MPTTSIQQVSNEQLQQLAAAVEAAAGQDMPFLTQLIELQTKLIGGLSGAVFVLRPQGEPRLVTVYPLAPDRQVRVEPDRVAILRDCVERCRKAATLSVYRVGMGGRVYHAVCTPLVLEAKIEGVTIVMTAPQDRQELTPYLAHLQWAARLYPGHVAARRLRRQLRDTADTRKALNTLTAVHQAERFVECAMAVCNQLSLELNADRVSLGWTNKNSVRLVGMSDTENLDRRQELSQRLQAAMEECFDQAQPIVVPTEHLAQEDQALRQVVSRCHRSVSDCEGSGAGAICSVPLRRDDEAIGVVTVERSLGFDSGSVTLLQAIADLVAPSLADRFDHDRSPAAKVWVGVRTGLGKLLGPEQVALKLIGLGVFAALLYMCLAQWNFRVEAPFRFEPATKRVYAAPFSGYVESVWVREGDEVEAGDPLIQLDDRHLHMMRDAAESRRQIAEIDLRRAWDAPDQKKRFEAEMKMHEAERDLYDLQIEEATLAARDSGVVVAGDWSERIGVRVELGQALLEIAPSQLTGPEARRLRAVIRVDERDVDRVAVGSIGVLATRGAPTVTTGLAVTRVVPVGQPHEGRNVFAVYATLDEEAQWMQPGMEGVAKIDAGRRTVLWILTHELVDFLRLALW